MIVKEFEVKGIKGKAIGKFVITENMNDKYYPSITIEYVSNQEKKDMMDYQDNRPSIRIEYDKEDKQLMARVWSDPNSYEPTDDIELDRDYIKHIEE